MNKMGIGVGVLVLNEEGKVLLLLRNSDFQKADSDMRLEGTYTLPSGKVLYQETFEEAAVRKLEEEAGLHTTTEDVQVISLSNDINSYAHYATIGLWTKKYEGEVRLKDSSEFVSCGFFDLEHLPENTCIPSLKIIKNYKDKIIYQDKEWIDYER